MHNRRTSYALIVALLITITACSSTPKPVTLPPGAISQFDATSYEALMGAQAVLNSIKSDLSKLPPAAKPALNKAIASYNIAENAWQTFHAGKATDPNTVTLAIAQAVADVAVLLSQSTGGN